MGNTESSNIKELNTFEEMSMNDKNWLIKEFEKEKNIVGRISDSDFLIRIQKIVNGKKHYYFNISAFFDPDKGFIKCFLDIYKRYKDIKKVEEIMPFACLIFQPLDKIEELLKITPGSYLDFALGVIYSIGISISVFGVSAFFASRIHPILGVALYAGVFLTILFEDIKGSRELANIKKLEKEDELLISRIFNLFTSSVHNKIVNANIIEIVVEEKYNNLLQALVTEFFVAPKIKDLRKVEIKLWDIPEINKAIKLKEFSDSKKPLSMD